MTLPALKRNAAGRALDPELAASALYQVQSGFPFTISVFGDTANAGTVLGENPIRANYTGQPVFGPERATRCSGSTPRRSPRRPPTPSATWAETPCTGPGMQTLDLALVRAFAIREARVSSCAAKLFNALNHTNLGTPNRFVNTPQFGTITEASTPAGKSSSARASRSDRKEFPRAGRRSRPERDRSD